VVPVSIRDFFLGSAGVAGALIGLLFVAMSITAGQLAGETVRAQLHRIRAAAALTAFSNALVVSLFALVPGHKIGPAALSVAAGGILFVAASLLSLHRLRLVRSALRDALFLLSLVITFVIQLVQAAEIVAQPANPGSVSAIAILVIVCFLIGIARAWELIGGPSIGIGHEVTSLVRHHSRAAAEPGSGRDEDA
jgi:hypothetical protein